MEQRKRALTLLWLRIRHLRCTTIVLWVSYSMYVCMYVCMYVFIFFDFVVATDKALQMYNYCTMNELLYVCKYVCMYICGTCMYTFICVCKLWLCCGYGRCTTAVLWVSYLMYVCMYVCMYVFIFFDFVVATDKALQMYNCCTMSELLYVCMYVCMYVVHACIRLYVHASSGFVVATNRTLKMYELNGV